MFYIPDRYLDELIEEDLHIVDMTTDALKIESAPGRVVCAPKRPCVLAGVEEAARIFDRVGARSIVLHPSGSALPAQTPCLEVSGTAGALHAAYKVAQNVMEYASGIATRCAEMVQGARAAAPHIEICVTRKHFPGGKRLSVKAALAGGASVHRLGLSDSILIFDQHRVFTGGTDGLRNMLQSVSARFPEKKIAAEVDSPEEARTLAQAGIDILQCERFIPESLTDTVRALRALSPHIKITAAGGVNAENAATFAATGVDALVTSWPYFGKPQDIKMTFSVR